MIENNQQTMSEITARALRKCMYRFAESNDSAKTCVIVDGMAMMSVEHLAKLYGCTHVYIRHAMKVGLGGTASIAKFSSIFDLRVSEFLMLGEIK